LDEKLGEFAGGVVVEAHTSSHAIVIALASASRFILGDPSSHISITE
jgi:hypothetical protein